MTSRRKFIAVLSAGVSWAAIARAATFTGSGVDDQGNTITFTLTETITPASLYVAANGNDNNNGKSPSAPFQTIAKINSLVLAHGSSVLFNGGDTFAGNLLPNIDGNGDPNNPVIIGSYGTGQATLVAGVGGETGVVNIEQMSGVTVRNLIIRGATVLTNMPRGGIRIGNNSATRRTGITVDNCDIGGITYFEATQGGNPSVQGTNGFGIYLAGYPGAGFDVTITNNKVHGLNGPTSHDDVGIGGFGNGSNIGVTLNNNLVYNIGGGPPGLASGVGYPPMGDGIAIDGSSGGLVQNCTVHDCGANYRNPAGGPAGFLSANSRNVKFYRCLAYNIAPSDFSLTQVDFVGFDLDNDSNGCTIDSCYAHDCYNSGFMLFSNGDAGWNNNTITNCLAENNCRGGLPGFGEITINLPGASDPTITVQKNTTFNNRVYTGQQFHNDNQGAVGIGSQAAACFKAPFRRTSS